MSLYDAAKDALKLARASDNVELVQKILDLQREAVENEDERRALRQRVGELEDALRYKGTLVFRRNAYWIDPTGSADEGDGPFCSRCWDKDHSLVRLHDKPSFHVHACPACNTVAKDPSTPPGDAGRVVRPGRRRGSV